MCVMEAAQESRSRSETHIRYEASEPSSRVSFPRCHGPRSCSCPRGPLSASLSLTLRVCVCVSLSFCARLMMLRRTHLSARRNKVCVPRFYAAPVTRDVAGTTVAYCQAACERRLALAPRNNKPWGRLRQVCYLPRWCCREDGPRIVPADDRVAASLPAMWLAKDTLVSIRSECHTCMDASPMDGISTVRWQCQDGEQCW